MRRWVGGCGNDIYKGGHGGGGGGSGGGGGVGAPLYFSLSHTITKRRVQLSPGKAGSLLQR